VKQNLLATFTLHQRISEIDNLKDVLALCVQRTSLGLAKSRDGSWIPVKRMGFIVGNVMEFFPSNNMLFMIQEHLKNFGTSFSVRRLIEYFWTDIKVITIHIGT
jgi:hypothetical protein